MAMSGGEAQAFNVLARYFLTIPSHGGPVSDDRVLNALLLLREKGFKNLGAGPSEREIREAFARFTAPPAPLVPEALDGAMWACWLHGRWRVTTAEMSDEQREAAADAVIRYDRDQFDDPAEPLDVQAVRWWR